jgi:hypothetical protein
MISASNLTGGLEGHRGLYLRLVADEAGSGLADVEVVLEYAPINWHSAGRN